MLMLCVTTQYEDNCYAQTKTKPISKWEGLYGITIENDEYQMWLQIVLEKGESGNKYHGREVFTNSIDATDEIIALEAYEEGDRLIVEQKSGFYEMYYPSLGGIIPPTRLDKYTIEHKDGKFYLCNYNLTGEEKVEKVQLLKEDKADLRTVANPLNFSFTGTVNHFACDMVLNGTTGECSLGKYIKTDNNESFTDFKSLREASESDRFLYFELVSDEGVLKDAKLEGNILTIKFYNKQNKYLGEFYGVYSGLKYIGTYTDTKGNGRFFYVTKFFSIDELEKTKVKVGDKE